LVRTEEHEIAVLRCGTFEYLRHDLRRQEFQYRRLQSFDTFAARVDLDIGQSFCTIDLAELRVAVDLAARNRTAIRHPQRRDTAATQRRRVSKNLEFDFLHDVGE